MQNPDLYSLYALAERLHKTVSEVLEISVAEWIGWLAYVDFLQQKSV